jgi:hypothetical protein
LSRWWLQQEKKKKTTERHTRSKWKPNDFGMTDQAQHRCDETVEETVAWQQYFGIATPPERNLSRLVPVRGVYQ